MAIYRFRVYFEENEDVYRDIDIKASQNFESFHECIQESYKFDKKHAASFFSSDDYWRKGEEITLRKEDLALNEYDIRKNITKKYLMSDAKIAKFIEQPHQRFLYVFDPAVQWTFLIEMVKIVNDDPKISYPFCTRSIGVAPKQYKQLNIIKDETGPDALIAAILAGGANDEDEPEEEIYKSIAEQEEGIEEDDLESLEGEEGEESDEMDEDNEESSFEEFDEEEH